MPRTRRIYRSTCTTVDCANALRRTILIGLLVSVWPTLIHLPPVSAKPATIKDLLALRGAMPNSNDDSVKVHSTQLLVRFEPSTSRAVEQTIHDRAGANVLKRYRSVEGLCLVEVAEGQREDARKRYAAEPQVLYAQDNHRIHLAAVPDDPSFPLQWGLRNTGQTVEDLAGGDDPGTPGADIRAEGAWDLTTGDAAFRIAVLDTGVDYNHPDLAGNIWTNPGEIPGNGVDDDGNGWVDDLHGYDFANDDGDPFDDHSHGTHVAGILGAVGNNGVGVTGVNWQCQIVALKILDSAGYGWTSDAIDAIDYMIDNRILLSNNSWGTDDGVFDPDLYAAVGRLQSIGHLFVAAAGNLFGRNIDVYPQYPASFDFPHLIVVGGVDNDDVMSVFSNIGPLSVDVSAPSDNVWSTLPGGSYGYATGTSMATPHVTGTAALLWGRRPELGWSDVRSRLLRSVRPVPTLIGRTVTGGIIDASVAVGDCNHNGVPDEEDIAQGGSEDCNSDGFPDECEPDCNETGTADACDIATGASEDCNGNAVPDECELAAGSTEDCNGNAVPDECDLVSGGSEDLNGTGVPDECETCSVATDCDDANACTDDSCPDGLCFWIDHTGPCDDGDLCTSDDVCLSGSCVGMPVPDAECSPVFSMKAVAINGIALPAGPLSEVTVMQGDRLTIEMFVRNWSPQLIQTYNIRIDTSGYTSGTTGSLGPVVEPNPDVGAFIEKEHPDFLFFGRTALAITWNTTLSFYQYGAGVLFEEACAVDAGGSAYLGTLILDIGATASGSFQMCLNENIDEASFLTDCSLIHFASILFECLTIVVPLDDCTAGEDCNGNGSWDICDISDGTSEDCNGNDTPDDCDLDPTDPDGDGFVSDDCNGNGVPDDCDIAGGASDDCDGNGLPDECDLLEDCNGNGMQDTCDIDSGFSEDCNGNDVPDACDIDSGFSEDCNGDGVPDECDGSGLLFVGATYPTGPSPRSVAIGDLNGDQVPDLAAATLFGTNNVSVLLGVGDGTFGSATKYTAGETPSSVTIGDLNGDLVPDLAVANSDSDNVSVLLGVGDGTFAPAVNFAAGDEARSVAIGDLNGDQVPDLAVANRRSDDISVLLGLGDGTFAPAVHYAFGLSPTSIAIGDLDGDLVPDLAVANRGTFPEFDGNVSVLLGVGDGTFAAAVHYATGDFPSSVAIGDLNRDQVPDLAVANSNDNISDNISVLLGVGDGTFAAAMHYAAGDGPRSVAIGDLNGDRIPDLAVANAGPIGPLDGDVSVLLGFGDGTFAATVNFAAGDNPISVAIGDLDGDLLPDLAVVDTLNNNVSVLLNQSTGGCNGNCIPDECDIDCGSPGGPCDLPGCGQSADCNGNGLPDECDTGVCGDGCLTGTEECDDGPNNSDTEPGACRTTCVLPSCGDGVMDAGEACDDGLNNSDTEPDACRTTCVLPSCGDGAADTGETCDDGQNNSDTAPDACRTDCSQAGCGDGVVDTGEECDDGNTEPGDGCDENCMFDPGACCLGTACSVATEINCLDSGGTFFGSKTTCNAPDADGDGLRNECDGCPADANKIEPGTCGCGLDDDADSDDDNVPDCEDQCPGVDDALFGNCTGTIPTVSMWGLTILALLLFAGSKVVFRTRLRRCRLP